MASPASRANTPTVEIMVNDLLLHFSSIRAGFVVSTDAYVPRGLSPLRRPHIGDVVLGIKLPDMAHGVIYFDAEKTNKENRLVMTGQSANTPSVVVSAVEKLRRQEQNDSGPIVLHGVIASSRQEITDSVAAKIVETEHDILCFETAASTIKAGRFTLLVGTTRYCGENEEISAREQTCKAVISHLTRIIQHIVYHELQVEPAITEYLEYENLDLGKPACRLLKLEGGTGELQCQIFQAYLPSDKKTSDDRIHDETMLIPFEALSYCWGSNTLTDVIRVNGKTLLVTSNLFQALGYLRFTDRDRILWIDAICINQNDMVERGHQVDMMGRLYRQADEVLVWLGDIGDRTGGLISMLRAFEANVPHEARQTWTSEDIRYRNIWDLLQCSTLEDKSSLQSMMRDLMSHPWFSRVWIIQEVANAKKASLGCTNGWIDARTFAVVPKLLQIDPTIQCQSIIDIMPGASRRSSWFRKRPNLSTLLRRFAKSRASDPRDKVFALLDISSDKPIVADYGKTEQNVVEDLVKYFLQDKSSPLDLDGAKINALQKPASKGLEQFILRGGDLDLKKFTTRYTGSLLLTTETVEYLRYIRSPLLEQLVHLGFRVLSEKATTATSLAEFLVKNKIQVTAEILRASFQNGIGFVPMFLERDDIEINRDIITEAISHGPIVLKKFFEKCENETRSTKDVNDGEEKQVLIDFQRLKNSFEHGGVFPKVSETLRRLLYQRSNKRLSDPRVRVVSISPYFMEHDEIITEAELQTMDATLQAFLRQTYDQSKVTDETRVKAVRGGQDGIEMFLRPYVSRFDDDVEDLISKYPVEVFLSSRANDVEILHKGMWPEFLDEQQRHELSDRYDTMVWKVLVPYRFTNRS